MYLWEYVYIFLAIPNKHKALLPTRVLFPLQQWSCLQGEMGGTVLPYIVCLQNYRVR